MPISIDELTPQERKKAVQALMFLSEKCECTVKGRLVYNSANTRKCIDQDKVTSPAAAQESVILTGIIDMKEERDMIVADVSNMFIHACIPNAHKVKERIIMKITGVLVDILSKWHLIPMDHM